MIGMTGLLWFDPDPKATFADKVSRAAKHYAATRGKTPNICVVHPSMPPDETKQVESVEIRTSRSIIPNHFWIVVEE